MSAIFRTGLLCAAMVLLAAGGSSSALAGVGDATRLPKPRPALATDAPPVVEQSLAAGDDAGVAPLPRPRPLIEAPPAVADWANDAAEHFTTAASPTPPRSEPQAPAAESTGVSDDARPDRALAAIEDLAPLPRPRPDDTASPVLALVMPPHVAPLIGGPVAPEDAGCVDRIRALGVEFTEAEPMDVGGTCAVPHPLKLSSLGSGISIGPDTLLNCAETESLARWMKEVVVPASTRLLGAAPTKITQDSAYVCRNRYDDPHQKISEHAHANALDIASFSFKDRDPVDIGRNKEGSAEAKFEAEIRKGSCDYFTTVLGPGSNAAHATHFHLDMAFRRGGYRICELGAPVANVAVPATDAAPAKTKRE